VGKSADSHGTGPWFEYQSPFFRHHLHLSPSIARPIKGVLKKRLKNVVVSTVEEKYLSPQLGALQKRKRRDTVGPRKLYIYYYTHVTS
jgi:hypothetical protein